MQVSYIPICVCVCVCRWVYVLKYLYPTLNPKQNNLTPSTTVQLNGKHMGLVVSLRVYHLWLLGVGSDTRYLHSTFLALLDVSANTDGLNLYSATTIVKSGKQNGRVLMWILNACFMQMWSLTPSFHWICVCCVTDPIRFCSSVLCPAIPTGCILSPPLHSMAKEFPW